MATANTFTQIGSTVTVGSGGAANIEFTSIPATYTDLVVKFSVRSDTGSNSAQIQLQLNSAAGSALVLRGSGAAATSYSNSLEMETGRADGGGSTSNVFTNGEFYIPNYANATAHSVSSDAVTENNGATAYAELTANLSTSTAAVTAVKLLVSSTNFVQYSTASLYGILKY